MIGSEVSIIPTEGCHQKTLTGTVIGETKKQIRVKVEGWLAPRSFRRSDGHPILKYDRQFPCYCLKIEPT